MGERELWQVPGVVVTAIGHQGGHTLRPTYEEVCTGRTAETVMVVYDLDQVCQASGRRMVPFRSTE